MPRSTDPSKPPSRRDLSKMSAPARARYLDLLARQSDVATTKVRARRRRADPRAPLPPICGAPLDRPKKPGAVDDDLTPNEIRRYKIEDTYLTICTRLAGQDTSHEGEPGTYCRRCETAAKKKLEKGVPGMATGAEIRKVEFEAQKRRDLYGKPIDIGPHEVLLQEVQRTAGIVEWLELVQKALAADTPDDEEVVGFLVQMGKMGMEPSALYTIFQQERNHLVQAAKTAIACGVAERRVRIAEEQGRLLVMVIQAFVHDPQLGLTPAQLNVAPSLIRKHMLAVPAQASPAAYVDTVASGHGPIDVNSQVEVLVE